MRSACATSRCWSAACSPPRPRASVSSTAPPPLSSRCAPARPLARFSPAPSWLALAQGGGLFVVGSYVPKTSGQVAALLDQTAIERVEIDVAALLDDKRQFDEVASAAAAATDALRHNRDIVLYTSRRLISGDGADHSLAIGQRVSASLVAIVQGLGVRPRYLVAKGGITSSDIATKALKLRRAMVLGQILPGVPVWRTGDESLYPGLAYVVFPGNVGGDDALVRIQREPAGLSPRLPQ